MFHLDEKYPHWPGSALVVNVRGLPPNSPGIVYCGRPCAGWRGSVLANPFRVRRGASWEEREACLDRYHDWLVGRVRAGDEAIIAALSAIEHDTVLGCWCAPLRCHCSVIHSVAILVKCGIIGDRPDPNYVRPPEE